MVHAYVRSYFSSFLALIVVCVFAVTWSNTWCILSRTENFSSPEEPHCVSIRNENRIYSAAENGRVPFVSANDVARVAFCALTNQQPHNTDHIILGPELFTYDEVQRILFENTLSRAFD
jgi:uncharacterized protein YbjT (DUF2867 family)